MSGVRGSQLVQSSWVVILCLLCIRIFHPSSCIPAERRMGRERCAGTVTVRRGGDRLAVTGYAGTVSCSLSQLFILPAGIFLKQILPCVLRLGFVE